MTVKHKILILIIISLVSFSLLFFLVINVMQSRNTALKQEIIKTRQKFTDQQKEIQTILKNNKTFADIDVSKIDYIFLEKENALFLIDTLERLGSENNCQINISLTEPNEKNKDYEDLNLELNMQGEFNNILNFFNAVEKENFYINYEKINIFSHPMTANNFEKNNDADIYVKVEAKTFWK